MVLSKELKKSPNIIAQNIVDKIKHLYPDNFSSVDIAAPGFINFKIEKKLLFKELEHILSENENFGKSKSGDGKRALIEFVSANPTGPLTIGHGRGAILGDVVSNLLDIT